MPYYLISSTSKDRHIFRTHSAIEIVQLICSTSGPGNGELCQHANSVPLLHLEGAPGVHPSPILLDIGVLSTCVGCVRYTLLLMPHGRPWCHLVQHLIKLWHQKKHDEPKELRSRTEQFRSTNWSVVAPRADFFSFSTIGWQTHTSCCPVSWIRENERSPEYCSKGETNELKTWSKGGVILDWHSFGTEYSLIECLLQ